MPMVRPAHHERSGWFDRLTMSGLLILHKSCPAGTTNPGCHRYLAVIPLTPRYSKEVNYGSDF